MEFTLVFINDPLDNVDLIEAIIKPANVSYVQGSLNSVDCMGLASSECRVEVAGRDALHEALTRVFGDRFDATEVTSESAERKSWHCSGSRLVYIGPASAPVVAPENVTKAARTYNDHLDALRRDVEPL